LEPIIYSWASLLKGLAMLPEDIEIIRDETDYTDNKDLF
jgi:hypothetical protein